MDPAIPPNDEPCGPSWASPPSACRRRRRHCRREAGAGGAVPPPPTASREDGASCMRLRPTRPRPTAAATSQKWQRCHKSKLAKWERGRECVISCSQVAHLRGHTFISRNQYEITKSTAKKDFQPSRRDFCPFGSKNLKRVENFNCSVICSTEKSSHLPKAGFLIIPTYIHTHIILLVASLTSPLFNFIHLQPWEKVACALSK